MKVYDAVIIGSGAAGLNAADCLHSLGVTNIAIITEGLYSSTSINTGSDKQTYYKLSTTGGEKDSVLDMANTYYSCGGIEGFHALTESALSLRCFFKLVEAGVPFPMNEYGEYVGYRTDHDARKRASSCGPLTSKYMCTALIKKVLDKKIEVIEGKRVVRLLTDKKRIAGCAAMDILSATTEYYAAKNVILAVGGPAGIYSSSVYPECQTGGIGAALREGAAAVSLSEWQYGIASVDFRWNLSGSYQQVIPRYVSADGDGNLREFLPDYVGDKALDLIFQKGYNWPFTPKNLGGKSSMIDIAVYCESILKGRRVFLDYRSDPHGFDANKLSDETRTYLENSNLLDCKTPIERLKKLNSKAYELYLTHGIDLEKVPLEIRVCSQHCNGGLKIDRNYMTTIGGLYACGECAGVFGVTRPGGSALNSTQVSSLMASIDISKRDLGFDAGLFETAKAAVEAELSEKLSSLSEGQMTPGDVRKEFSEGMTKNAAFIRNTDDILRFSKQMKELYRTLFTVTKAKNGYEKALAFVNEDLLLTLLCVLESQICYAKSGHKSRGGYIIPKEDNLLNAAQSAETDNSNEVVDTFFDGSSISAHMRPVSPIPQSEQWFEKVAFGK